MLSSEVHWETYLKAVSFTSAEWNPVECDFKYFHWCYWETGHACHYRGRLFDCNVQWNFRRICCFTFESQLHSRAELLQSLVAWQVQHMYLTENTNITTTTNNRFEILLWIHLWWWLWRHILNVFDPKLFFLLTDAKNNPIHEEERSEP